MCRKHGGGAPQVRRKAKLRLAELVDPAIATLAREMTTATRSGDRLRAAENVLDRTGHGRGTTVEVTDPRAELLDFLLDLKGE